MEKSDFHVVLPLEEGEDETVLEKAGLKLGFVFDNKGAVITKPEFVFYVASGRKYKAEVLDVSRVDGEVVLKLQVDLGNGKKVTYEPSLINNFLEKFVE